MNPIKPSDKQRMISSAIQSVTVEGLTPDDETRKLLNEYADGRLSAEELRLYVLNSVKKSIE